LFFILRGILATVIGLNKNQDAADGDMEFGRVYKRLLMADGNMQSRPSGEYAVEDEKV
jgi:hypothetical protein